MSIISQLYARNRKLVWIFVIALAAGILNLFTGKPSDPLAEHKKQIKTELPAEAEKALEKALLLIEKDDMDSLFKMMVHNNKMVFNEGYRNGLFAEKDFYPARLTEDPAMRFSKSSKEHVIVKLFSEKRNTKYVVSMQKVKNVYKIYSIMQDISDS